MLFKLTTGSTITALTLDMSAAGAATFNSTITSTGLNIDTTDPFMSFKESGATKLFIGESSVVGGGGAGYYDFYAVAGLGQRFFTGAAERMRIDSSGNLLIATTSTSTQNLTSGGGTVISSLGGVASAYQSQNSVDPVVSLNNTGVDGAIQEFRKDGTTVGSIGVIGGDDLFIAGGSTGIRFDSGVGKIYPTNGSGTVSDNTVDIGEVNYQFKDLHLSGTANVGGITVNSAFTFPTADGSSGQALENLRPECADSPSM